MAELAQQLKERLSYFVERVRTFKFTLYNQENQGNEVLGETKIMETTQVVKERAFVLGDAEDKPGYSAKGPGDGQTG